MLDMERENVALPQRSAVSAQLLSSAKLGNWEEFLNQLNFLVKDYHDLVKSDETGRTILHYACLREDDRIATKTAEKILDKLYYLNISEEEQDAFVDKADITDMSAIHIAAVRKKKRLVALLVSWGADLNLPKNGGKKQAIRLIYKNTPKVILDLLDQQLRIEEDEEDPSKEMWEVEWNFTPITGIQPHDQCAVKNERDKIYMLESQTFELATALHQRKLKRSEVLRHPLVQIFLHFKNKKFKFWIGISIAYHILWSIISIIFFVVDISSAQFPNAGNAPKPNDTAFNGNQNQSHIFKPEDESRLYDEHLILTVWKWMPLIVIYAGLHLFTTVKEALELWYCPNQTYYWSQLENYGQWSLFILPVVGAIAAVQRLHYLVNITSVAGILIAGFLVLGQFNKTEYLGVYMEILVTVMKNIFKFFMFFSPLLFTFSLVFRLLMPEKEEFWFPWAAKVVTMMIGELEYNDLFHGEGADASVPHPVLTKIVFLGFIVTVTIVLQNLLVGLTLDEIQELKKKSKENHLAKQLEQIYLLENFLLLKPVKCIFVTLGMGEWLAELMVEPTVPNGCGCNAAKLADDNMAMDGTGKTLGKLEELPEKLQEVILDAVKEYPDRFKVIRKKDKQSD